MMYSLTLTKRANVVLHESVLNEILTDNHINTGKKSTASKKFSLLHTDRDSF